MLKLEQALLVEGKYDAARLSNIVDGTILTTDGFRVFKDGALPVSYTHLRAHETDSYLVCRLLLEKKKKPIMLSLIHN